MSNQLPTEPSLKASETTGFMRSSAGMDGLDSSNHIISTENSVSSSLNAETGLKKPSSGATIVSASSSRTGNTSNNEKKEDIGASSTKKGSSDQDRKNKEPMVLQMNAPPHPVAEFLFQLTKMLTDDNKEFIEWRKASIFVHDPPGLEKNILPKYFRHSNYSSFQRQMNYFGFRKIAGKGKMAPCSYVNENAKEDISSLLFIKRKKTGVSSKAANAVAQHNAMNPIGGMNYNMMGGSAGLRGGLGQPPLMGYGSFQGMNQMMPSHVSNTSINEAALYREQQQMLAQLQQAHASASSGAGLHGAPSSGGQFKHDSFGSNIFNSGLQTTDRGGVFHSSSHQNSDWNIQYPTNMGNANPQSLSSANTSQGNGIGLDSSANFRALLNQQISYFNNPNQMSNTNQGLTMPPAQMQGKQDQPFISQNEQSAGTGSAAPAGKSSAENEALIRQLEQQLFEAQALNGGMGGLVGHPRGSGN
jgi:hypothetical protein